jgi:uncharacterized membrane protein YphA (DoxX/SURF4 family)
MSNKAKTGWWNKVLIEIKRYRHWIGVEAGIILGLIFVAAGVGKMLHEPEAFRIFLPPFPDILSPIFVAEAVFIWLPRVELIIGLLLILGIVAKLAATFGLVLIAGFIVENSLLLIQGHERCPACFGPQLIIRTSEALFIDVTMVILVLIIFFCYQRSFWDIRPWFLKRGGGV